MTFYAIEINRGEYVDDGMVFRDSPVGTRNITCAHQYSHTKAKTVCRRLREARLRSGYIPRSFPRVVITATPAKGSLS